MVTRAQARVPTAVWASVCGGASATGGLLTWVTATGPRPTMGMDHTSFSRMLVYTLAPRTPYVKSVVFAFLVLGIAMVIGALSGLRILTALSAVVALAVGGMWIGLVVHHYNTPQLPNSYSLDPAHLPWSALRAGAWLTLGSASFGLLSTLVPGGWTPILARADGGAGRRPFGARSALGQPRAEDDRLVSTR
jgi:hypothetical protein